MTNDERETINRTLHKWLGHCIHSNAYFVREDCGPGIDTVEYPKCDDCGEIAEKADVSRLPDYHSWGGTRLLLEVLTKRPDPDTLPKYWVRMEFHSGLCSWVVTIGSHVIMPAIEPQTATADTLPLALVAATMKLIERRKRCQVRTR